MKGKGAALDKVGQSQAFLIKGEKRGGDRRDKASFENVW